MDKIYQWRMEGMMNALRIVEEGGVDALKEDLRMRGFFQVKAVITPKEMKEFESNIIQRVQKVILVFALSVLRDEFGFGPKRANQFMKRFNAKCGGIAEGYLTWQEQLGVLEDEIGIKVEFK